MSQNKQLFEAITLISDQKNLSNEAISASLKDAIVKAYNKYFNEANVEVDIDFENQSINVYEIFNVVQNYDDLNDYNEIALEDAKKIQPDIKLNETLKKPIDLKSLERSVVLYIFQVFRHNINIQVNKEVFNEWSPKLGTIVELEVEKIDSKSDAVIVNMKNTSGFLSVSEQIPGERLIPGNKYMFYIKDVKEQSKGWPIILSRADAGLVRCLLEQYIPEIQEKIVEIKDIGRIAGFKTKISLISHQNGVEPAGTIIGPHGSRIKMITEKINNEKIEVVDYDSDLKKYIVNICSPVEISGLRISEPKNENERRKIDIVVRNDKVALLIGKKGANVKLLSQILNANVDVVSVEDAKYSGLPFEFINFKTLQQRQFDHTLKKYQVNFDSFNQPNLKIDNYVTSATNLKTTSSKTTKKTTKNSLMDEINAMSKEDALKEIASAQQEVQNNESSNEFDEYDEEYDNYK